MAGASRVWAANAITGAGFGARYQPPVPAALHGYAPFNRGGERGERGERCRCPLAECRRGGGVSKLGEDAGKAASGAAKTERDACEDSREFRQLRKSACKRARSGERSNTLERDP